MFRKSQKMKTPTQDDFYDRKSHETITVLLISASVQTARLNLTVNIINSYTVTKWNKPYHFCIGKIIYLLKDLLVLHTLEYMNN